MKNLLILLAAAALLAGCKANEIELRVDTQDIQAALSGEDVSVRFIARFENFGTIDGEKRSQLDAIQSIAEATLQIDDYNVVSTSSKSTITVEGEIPVVVGEPGSYQGPFALYVWEARNELLPGFSHALQLNTGQGFETLQARMRDVNFMLAIDEVQPVLYRLRSNSGADIPVLAGGGQIDGAGFAVRAFSLKDGERMNLTFKDGAYDTVYGGVLLGLP